MGMLEPKKVLALFQAPPRGSFLHQTELLKCFMKARRWRDP